MRRLGELRLAQVAVGPNAPSAGPVFPSNDTPIERIDSTSSEGSNNEKISRENVTSTSQELIIPRINQILSSSTTRLLKRIATTFLG